MNILRKLTGFIKARPTSPQYTKREWIFKCTTLFLAAVGMDLTGAKLYFFDSEYYYGRLNYEQAYGFQNIYFWAMHGLCLALALWKLFEIYWWGKDYLAKWHAVDSVT